MTLATYGPVQLPAFLNSDATFRAFASGVHTALAAIGLVNTSDTGQINLSTVTMPIAINTSAGYEIWRLNDTLQATVPYFFKIEYGTGNPIDRPSLWVTTGSTTNGAGTLGGQLGTRRQSTGNSSKPAGATLPIYASGDTSRFALSFNADAAASSYPGWIICERTRDATGVYTADGLVQIAVNALSTYCYISTIPASGTAQNDTNGPPILPVVGGGNIHAAATDAAIGTINYFIAKPFYGLSVVEVAKADVGSVWGATWTATVLGASHTFLNLLCYYPDLLGNNNSGSVYLGLLWE
jgi:hypothetical protein